MTLLGSARSRAAGGGDGIAHGTATQGPTGASEGAWQIAAKLMDIARPGDRVVVIFGAGHKHWLEQLLDHTPGFQVVDPLPYL